MNNTLRLPDNIDGQITLIYLAPDIIPQGRIESRFSVDIGLKKSIQNKKGELFLNATDVLNTLVISKRIQGNGFYYTSDDFAETQVFRLGYSYRF